MRVHPAMVPEHHPLASVRESFNAVFVEGDAVGSLMFYGRGAGGQPTASAVLGDVIDAAVNLTKGTHGSLGSFAKARIRPIDETTSEYLLGLEVADEPGVLHAVTGVLAGHGVSIRAAEQEGLGADARLVFITHDAKESAVQATVHDLRELPTVRSVGGLLRVDRDGDVLTCGTSRRAGRRPSSASPTCCSPGWPATAGCTCPPTWPALPRRRRARRGGSLRRRPPRPCSRRSSATTSPPTTSRAMCARRPTPRSATTPSCRSCRSTTDQWLAELFHGPTLAFKDVALQLVGRLFDHVLGQRGERVTIVGATSGDTGSAAIEGVRGCDRVDIVILYPRRRAERGAAPADDDGRRAERARRRRSRARSTTARTSSRRCSTTPRSASGCGCRRSTRSTGRG